MTEQDLNPIEDQESMQHPQSLNPFEQDLADAMLGTLFDEIIHAFTEHGGLNAVDTALNDINVRLNNLGCRYLLGPGAACEYDEHDTPCALGVPYFDPQTRETISVYWIPLNP
jgi:hypothetical protein